MTSYQSGMWQKGYTYWVILERWCCFDNQMRYVYIFRNICDLICVIGVSFVFSFQTLDITNL